MAVVVTFLVGIAVLYRFGEFARLADPYFRGVIEASLAIAIVAFLDDLYDWPFTVKLAAQVLGGAGRGRQRTLRQRPAYPLPGAVDPGLVRRRGVAGLDAVHHQCDELHRRLNGLASGVSLIACLFLAFIAEQHGGWFAYAAAGLLACGLVGFLPFNFPRARIFMGDVGSQFCGFILAVLAVVASRFDGVALSFLLVPMLLSGVLFDVAFTLVRRAAPARAACPAAPRASVSGGAASPVSAPSR